MGNSKLHEVLAVEADLEGKAKVIIAETKKVFNEKPAFTGLIPLLKNPRDCVFRPERSGLGVTGRPCGTYSAVFCQR